MVASRSLIDAEQIEELREVRRIPIAAQIGFGNADVAAAQQARGKAEIVNIHRGVRSGLDAAEPHRAAVGQGHVKRAMLEF